MKYCLTKSNPQVYKLRDALVYYRSHPDIEPHWTICKHAEPGDILFIGKSGESAGIYAKAIVASTTEKEELGDKFWVNPEEVAGKLVYAAAIESLAPMRASEPLLRRFSELERVAEWLRSQGAVLYLTDEEGEALLRFV